MRFNFVGEISVNSQDAKVPGFRDIVGKANGVGMNLVCIAEQNNRAFMECVGFKNDKIKTYDTENNAIEISWDDRHDADIVAKVASYKKNVIILNGQRHEFITTFDFINFIRENIDEIKGKEFTVTGQIQKNEYNGKISDRFQIQNMYEVTEEKEHQLRVIGEFFFNSDGVDVADWKKEQKIIINGYTREYMSKEHPAAYVSKSIVLDKKEFDFDDDAKLSAFAKHMNISLDGDNINLSLKKNTYYVQSVVLSYINGAEKIEFDESQLTEAQKEMIALGVNKVSDFRPAGSIYGNRVQLYKLVAYDLRGKYSDGKLIQCDETAKEFEENIYASVAKEETEDVLDKAMNKPTEISDDDLLG